MKFQLIAAAAVAALAVPVAHAALDLQVVGSTKVTNAFGLAYDGTNVWYSTYGGTLGRLDQGTMTLVGSTYNTGIWGELAWDGTNIAQANQTTRAISFFSNVDGTAQGSRTITGASGYGLIDGLDIYGGKIYYSPDIGNIFRADLGTGVVEANITQGSSGGFSGVQYVPVASGDFLIVVNDASNPRTLCRMSLAGVIAAGDCATLANDRYEGLAFDGRYIYAADYYGNRIDKIDLKLDGGSILVPPVNGIPEPETYALMLAGLGAVGFMARRRKQERAAA